DSGAKAGILAAFGRIIPLSVINAFPGGILNIHPSLLPKYRGSTPIEAAILNGDRLTGVSLMRLAQKMDAGPIFGQAELPLLGNESKQEIFEQLVERATSLLTTLLPGILSGSVAAAPQDESYATYVHTLTKEDGRIDWHKPAEIIEREI